MTGWAKGLAGAGLMLLGTGCVLPLEINFDDGVWDHVRGNGRVVQVAHALPAFDAVVAGGGVRVVVERTGAEHVTISAEENLLPYLDAEVRGGVLHVGPISGVNLSPRHEIVFHVESYEVVEVSASGGTILDVDVGWVPELWVSLSGASRLTAWGSADVQHMTLSGASRYEALDLRSEDVDAHVSGASQAYLWVRDRLEAEASGASHVRFRGNPWVSAHVSGASTVAPY